MNQTNCCDRCFESKADGGACDYSCPCHAPKPTEEWREELKILMGVLADSVEYPKLIVLIEKVEAAALERGMTAQLEIDEIERIKNDEELVMRAQAEGAAQERREILRSLDEILASYSIDRPIPPSVIRKFQDTLLTSRTNTAPGEPEGV